MSKAPRHTPPPGPAAAAYRRNYEAGWRASKRGMDLTDADGRGHTDRPGWEDGYVDWAVGDGYDRSKWHAWHARTNGDDACQCT